jgi:ADP-ribose pyrophosphatase YjhB (NUDIX family)
MGTVTCYDEVGNPVAAPESELRHCPAAFGILIEDGQVLLMRHPRTGLWQPPGGLLAAEESPRQAVRRCFTQEAGLPIQVGPLLYVEELYRVEGGQATHLSALYYAMERPATGFAGHVDANKPDHPEWVAVESLSPEQLQLGHEAIRTGALRLLL